MYVLLSSVNKLKSERVILHEWSHVDDLALRSLSSADDVSLGRRVQYL